MQAPTLPRRPSPPAPRPSSPSPRFPGLPAPPPAPLRPAAREERPAPPPPPLDRLRGSHVRLRLVDGSDFRGVLAEVARYELLVRVDGGRLVVLQKGALVFAEEVSP